MADETLRECPACGGKAVPVSDTKPNDPKGWRYHALRCENYCFVTTWQCTAEEAAKAWNTRVTDPALAAKDALHEAVVVALDHLTAGLGKREDVILELREAHLRAADVDHANRSLSPKEIRIKELEEALAAAQAEVGRLTAELADKQKRIKELEYELRDAVRTCRAGELRELSIYEMRLPLINVLTIQRWAEVLAGKHNG